MSSIKITNAVLLTMDRRKRILNGATITTKDDKISEIVNKHEKTTESDYDHVIDARGMIVMPGLINCHVHTVQTLFKGISPEGLKLLHWLEKYIFPMESVMDSEEVYTSSLLGYAEMIRSGTTTCADMQSLRYVDKAFEAAEKIGIRATIAKAMNDHDAIPETLREGSAESIKESQRLIKIWNNKDNGRLRCMFGPTFIQGCSKELLKETSEIANMDKIGIHTHAAESLDEVKKDFFRFKKRSVEILNDFDMVRPSTLLAHCIHISEKEFEILFRKRTNVIHCPSSNLKLASGICSVPKLLNKQINVALGVDGAACNNNLDMFKDMRLAALLSQISIGSKDFTTSAMNVLEMATNSGAKALNMEDKIGSLEVGKKADMILVNINNIETTPLFNIPNQLVYSTDGHNIETVIIDGKIILKNRKLSYINEEKLILESQLKAKQIAEKSGISR